MDYLLVAVFSEPSLAFHFKIGFEPLIQFSAPILFLWLNLWLNLF